MTNYNEESLKIADAAVKAHRARLNKSVRVVKNDAYVEDLAELHHMIRSLCFIAFKDHIMSRRREFILGLSYKFPFIKSPLANFLLVKGWRGLKIAYKKFRSRMADI